MQISKNSYFSSHNSDFLANKPLNVGLCTHVNAPRVKYIFFSKINISTLRICLLILHDIHIEKKIKFVKLNIF